MPRTAKLLSEYILCSVYFFINFKGIFMLRTQVGHVCPMTGSIAVNTINFSGVKNKAALVSRVLNTRQYSLATGDVLKCDGSPFASKQHARKVSRSLSFDYSTISTKVVDVSMDKNIKMYAIRLKAKRGNRV